MGEVSFQLPPGYASLAGLDRIKHSGLGLRPGLNAGWCSGLNSVFLSAVELGKAALDYPVAFVREPGGEYQPVAVLGLRRNENLFVDEAGRWQPLNYQPAYVRRFPFCVVEVAAADGRDPQRLICVQEDQLAPSAAPFFDAQGQATPAWKPVQDLVESLEGARQQTRAFARRLDAFGLLTPFDALLLPSRGGQQLQLQGLHRVDEEKLNALGPREQKMLMRKGELRAIYAHLLSLENFAKLLDLTVQKDHGRRDPAH
jgi:hypothetical protein